MSGNAGTVKRIGLMPETPPAPAYVAAARAALSVLNGHILPIDLDDLAEAVAAAILAVQTNDDLLTRTQMAARHGVYISTLMGWVDKYPGFPDPVKTDGAEPRWHWPTVKAFLHAEGLPKQRRAGADQEAAEREARILAALRLYPDGLTSREIADLIGSEEIPVRGKPLTEHGILVRIEDRMRRLEAVGSVTRTHQAGRSRRSVITWKLP